MRRKRVFIYFLVTVAMLVFSSGVVSVAAESNQSPVVKSEVGITFTDDDGAQGTNNSHANKSTSNEATTKSKKTTGNLPKMGDSSIKGLSIVGGIILLAVITLYFKNKKRR